MKTTERGGNCSFVELCIVEGLSLVRRPLSTLGTSQNFLKDNVFDHILNPKYAIYMLLNLNLALMGSTQMYLGQKKRR